MVPSSAESMKLVVQIDEMMRKNGLILASIDSKDVVDKKSASSAQKNDGRTAETVSLSMKAHGSYESFRSFIKELEKSLRLIDVISVKISPVGQDDYSFSMEAVSYWRKMGDKT